MCGLLFAGVYFPRHGMTCGNIVLLSDDKDGGFAMPLDVNIPDDVAAIIKAIASRLDVSVGILLSRWIRQGIIDAEAEMKKKMAEEGEGYVLLRLPDSK